jgi:hypothetical protein
MPAAAGHCEAEGGRRTRNDNVSTEQNIISNQAFAINLIFLANARLTYDTDFQLFPINWWSPTALHSWHLHILWRNPPKHILLRFRLRCNYGRQASFGGYPFCIHA